MRFERCGTEFIQNKSWQRFCSTSCNNAWNYQQRKREQVTRAERVQRIVAARSGGEVGPVMKHEQHQVLVTRR
jgi:hypothetical protein